jgi:hypothetical protein
MASDLDEARGARTQSRFRAVNERVEEINRAFGDIVPLGDWFCECADPACATWIMLTHDEYEAIRADPRRFAVAASAEHLFEEIEDVVARHERYWVVEKRGLAGELATKVDPRRVRSRSDGESTASR